jgi:hypothetical protein
LTASVRNAAGYDGFGSKPDLGLGANNVGSYPNNGHDDDVFADPLLWNVDVRFAKSNHFRAASFRPSRSGARAIVQQLL